METRRHTGDRFEAPIVIHLLHDGTRARGPGVDATRAHHALLVGQQLQLLCDMSVCGSVIEARTRGIVRSERIIVDRKIRHGHQEE